MTPWQLNVCAGAVNDERLKALWSAEMLRRLERLPPLDELINPEPKPQADSGLDEAGLKSFLRGINERNSR